ncbi:MAG: thiol-disulfide oxidoreductase DCC family protein [Gaiella sp.]
MPPVPFPLVLYDENCRFCTALAGWLERRGLSIAAIGGPCGDLWLRDLPRARRYDSVHAVDALGRRHSAGAAVPVVLRALPGGRVLAFLPDALPGLTDVAYRLLARHRSTSGRMLGIR